MSSRVDEIIAGMNAPLDEQMRQGREQYNGNTQQNNRLSQFYDQQINGLRSNANLDLGTAVNRAAQLAGLSQETIAKNQEYLHSLMAPTHGGAGDAQTSAAFGQTASNVAGANQQMAQDIASQGQRTNDVLGQEQLAGTAHRDEMNYQQQLQRQALQRQVDAAKLQNAAQRPTIEGQIQDQALKAQVAQQEWGLKVDQFNSDQDYKNASLGLQAAKLSAGASPKPKSIAAGRYGNIPKRYDAAISKVYDALQKPQLSGIKDDPKTPDVDESHMPLAAPWRQAWNQLTDSAGLNPDSAAFLASKWYASSIDSSNPYNIRVMLTHRHVSPAAQKRIIEMHFGAGAWAKAQHKPAQPDLLGSAVGTISNTISGPH